MKEKSRNPRRTVGNPSPAGRTGGRPGERPTKSGRAAGKPGKGPANRSGEVSLFALNQLAEAGLLSAAGKRVREELESGRMGAVGRPTPAPKQKASPKAAVKAASGPRRLNDAEALVAERLQKVMARAGLASRRHSEELIQAGRVTVNGKVVTQLGTKVVPGRDLIEVDGRPLGKAEEHVYIIMNKPKGYVTTLYDPQGRKKVIDLLDGQIAQRVYPVGRLDYETEGLLLLTNDGELANALMHPAKQVKKTYIAKVRGVPSPSKISQLESGIELDDGPTAPAEVRLLEAHGPNAATLSIRIHEGRNRQVRRMFEAIGHEVIHLKRTTLGPLHLKNMKVGEWRELTPQELKDLRSAVMNKAAARGAYVATLTARRKAKRQGGAQVTERPARTGERMAHPTRPVAKLGSPKVVRAQKPGPRKG
jgi:23S rRNA pseudouridine2605 synthase